MISIDAYIEGFSGLFGKELLPWNINKLATDLIYGCISTLGNDFDIAEGIAIHKKARIEPGAVLKAPLILEAGAFIGAHAYLRGGVYIGRSSSIGPGCEIKSSIILDHSSIAHFNFIGDSILGTHVNFEAGAVIANHYNERAEKTISVLHQGRLLSTGVEKFGALVGDRSKIGANAVLSPGTLLAKGSVVRRLELLEQGKSLEP